MRSDLKLSIVTITYKDATNLGHTLRSLRPLLSELPKNFKWEHIVVDSSPEDHDSELRHLERDHQWPLKRVITPPRGIYAAINSGIEQAQGQFLWFLNSGDRLASTAGLLRAMAEFDTSPEPDIVASTAEFRRDDRFLYLHKPYHYIYRSLVGLNRLCHQALIYKHQVFEHVGPYSTELKLAADYEHHLRCIAAGVRIKAIPENVISIYDMSGRSNDYRKAFEEFRSVQRRWGPKLPLVLSWGNELVRPLELVKIATLKRVASSPLAELLRPFWLGFKRRL